MAFNVEEVARIGRKLYERHRSQLEPAYHGQYVLIDVTSEKFFLGDSPQAVYRKAVEAAQNGPYHLMRVGYPGAYRSRRSPDAESRRVVRR